MDRFKFRVWSVEEKTYDYKFPFNTLGIFYIAETGRLFSDFGNTVAPEMHEDRFIIEQCTGLKDKNGNLIYESDYVKANDVIYRVFWNKTKISLANILNSDIIDISETITMEIVGNEHKKDNISEIPKNTERRSD